MSARQKLALDQQLTIEEFLSFTDTRPDGERWELIEGVAVRSPPPTEIHQMVVADVAAYLMSHKNRGGVSWLPYDALVLFEVLSRSNTKADQAWRRKVYASVPNCRHYVTVSLKAVEVDAYDRESGWKKRAVTNLAGALDLPAFGLSIPLADIYRWMPLGPR